MNSFDVLFQSKNRCAPPSVPPIQYQSPFSELLALSQKVVELEQEVESECARINQNVRKNFLTEVN
jgi:hypothetical protein